MLKVVHEGGAKNKLAKDLKPGEVFRFLDDPPDRCWIRLMNDEYASLRDFSAGQLGPSADATVKVLSATLTIHGDL